MNSKFSELEAMMAMEGGTIDLEIPSFRIKRSHKKSRLGCVNCKKRRVKVSSPPGCGVQAGCNILMDAIVRRKAA